MNGTYGRLIFRLVIVMADDNQVDNKNILSTIKQRLGVPVAVSEFDSDILDGINAALAVLHQIGIGPLEGFVCEKGSQWSEFISDNNVVLSLAKTYIYEKTKMQFDPPGQPSALLSSLDDQMKEHLFRLNVYAENSYPEVQDKGGAA